MPVINAKVLTTTDQGLTELQKETARKNIDAIRKVDGVEGNIVTVGRDGEVQDSQVSIHVFRDVQADWADEAPDSPHHIRNKPGQLLADARVENDVLVIDKLYGGETVEFSGMTEAEREKLGGIAEGAQVNVIEDVQVAGDSLFVTGKTVNVPYAGASVNGVVKLTDDPDSVTENTAASPAAIRAALANFGGFMVVGLTDDPEPVPDVQDPSSKYIYLTKDEHSSEKDPYTEWIYVVPEQGEEPHWDVIGEASVDLSGYVEKVPSGTQGNITMLASDGGIADSAIAATGVADAVDKKHSHSNKATLDLVEEPYTTSEKTKLAGMEDFVESFVAPAYDPDRTAYYPGEICVYDDKCYRAKNIIMNGGSAIGEFDQSMWEKTNFADSRMQILNWWVTAGGAPSSEVTKKAVESGQLVGIRYVTPASPTNYQIKNTIFWLDHYYTDTAGNVIAKFVHTELTIYSEPQYEPYNGITYSIKNFLSSGDPCWTEESHDYKFYTAAEQHKLSGIAEGAQVNAIERITANGTPLNISNKAVDIPLATSEADGLLPHGKFPLIPPAPSLADGPDQVYSFDNDGRMSWQAIVKDYVGDMVLDQSGLPVEGEDGSPVFSEGSIRLWLSYKGTEFGARRAYDDHTGANIHDSIEARTTMAQVTAAIEAALANYGGFKVVDTLVDGHPDVQDPSERFIYLYKDPQGPEADPYTEWIYTVDNEWDVIGTTYVDLSPYYTSVEVESRLDTKVDKVTGKGLSTNDYTTEDKNKLTGIASGAQVNIIESVKVAGSALTIDSKSVNVPEAGGTTGAWVKGVVSGEDTARWDSWENISVTIPDHSLDGFLYLTYFENLKYYSKTRTTDTPVIGDITYYWYASGYETVPSTINEYVASSYTGLPAMTVLAGSNRYMRVENRQGFDEQRSTVLDILQSVKTFSFEVILNIGSFEGLWGGLGFGCSAGEANYGMNVNVYESSRGLGIGLPGWYGSETNRCTATDSFYLKTYDSGRDVHALPNDANKRRGIGIHHLAVVVDRIANEARGYFDGELAIRRPTISEIGNITNYAFSNGLNDTLQYTQFAIRDGDCSTNGGLSYPVPTKPYVKF